MSTVVGDVSVNVPVPFPLKGVDCVAKAAGNALRTVRRPKTIRIRNFMSLISSSKSCYKGSFSQSAQTQPSRTVDIPVNRNPRLVIVMSHHLHGFRQLRDSLVSESENSCWPTRFRREETIALVSGLLPL